MADIGSWEEYDKLSKELDAALSDPSAPKGVARALRSQLKGYEDKNRKVSPEVGDNIAKEMLGEPNRSFLPEGPQGGELLEQRIRPATGDTSSPMSKVTHELGAASAVAGKPHRSAEPVTSMEPLSEEHRMLMDRDEKLPSASGLKTMYAPPEYIPQGLDFTSALPSTFGGKIDHFVEPSFEQFKRDMLPAYGPAISDMSPDGPEFHQYADAQWKAIYDKAQASGHGAVRMQYAGDPRWHAQQSTGDKLFLGGMNALGAATSAASGADEMFLGLPSRAINAGVGALKDMGMDVTPDVVSSGKKLQEAFPVASEAGKAVAAISPRSAAGLATKGVGGAIGPLADIPVLGPALTQGLGSAAAQFGGEVTDKALDDQGVPRGLQGFDLGGAGERALETGALAGGLGAGFDLAARGAGKLSSELRAGHPELREAERAGMGTTSTVRGFKPSEDFKALTKRAGEEVQPAGLVSGELADKLTTQGRTTTEAAKNVAQRDVEKYHELTEHEYRPATKMLDNALDAHYRRSNRTGGELPGGNNGPLRGIISNLADVDAVSGEGFASLKAAQSLTPGARLVDGTEAAKYGIDTKGAMQRWARDNNVAQVDLSLMHPYDFKFVVKPKEFNPREWDETIGLLNRKALNEAGGKKGNIDPIYNEFMKSAREVRDTYPEVGPAVGKAYAMDDGEVLTGYSALKHEHEELARQAEDQLYAAGMPNEPPRQPGLRTHQGVAHAVQAYGRGSDQIPETVENLKALANQAGEGSTLRGLKGVYAAQGLKKGGWSPRANAALHLDPLLSTLALPSGERSFAQGIRPDKLPADYSSGFSGSGRTNSPLRWRGGAPGRAVVAKEKRPGETTLTPEEAMVLRRALMGVY